MKSTYFMLQINLKEFSFPFENQNYVIQEDNATSFDQTIDFVPNSRSDVDSTIL